MKRYENKKTEVVTKRECVFLSCDLCGRKADHLECEGWTWGGAGTASGELKWQYTTEDDWAPNELGLCYDCAEVLAGAMGHGLGGENKWLDLCYDCAEALAGAMGHGLGGENKRAELLALIGRTET